MILVLTTISCSHIKPHRIPSSEQVSPTGRLNSESEDYLSRLIISYESNSSISSGKADLRIDMARLSTDPNANSRLLLKVSMDGEDSKREFYEINENAKIDLIGKFPACLVYEVKGEGKRILRTKYFYMKIDLDPSGKYSFQLYKIKAINTDASFEDIGNLCSKKINLNDLSSDWEVTEFLNR